MDTDVSTDRLGQRVADASPGVLGYVVFVLASTVLFAAFIALEASDFAGLPPGSVEDRLALVPVLVLFGAFLAIPVGALGVVVIDVLTRRMRRQWQHVVVAAAVGALAGYLFTNFHASGATLGLATGLARFLVIPFVVRRRTPVERDFRPVA